MSKVAEKRQGIRTRASKLSGLKAPKGRGPFDFVLELLEPLAPMTRPMFGCTAIYVGEKIVMALRDKQTETQDNGVWLATTHDHHETLQRDLPSMRSIGIFGPKPSGWQILPADASDFEECAVRACELVLSGDPRIGKVPKQKRLRPGAKGKPRRRTPSSGKR